MIERKREVLNDALQLFIEKGVSSTSVQDIIEFSNISKGTFYNYFSSKNECLMAIFELASEDVFSQRRELSIGKDPSDKKVFAEQILVRLQINRKYNLFPVFEAVFHSGDLDLRAFVKNQHLHELQWLSDRITSVYGEESKPFTQDIAILFLGMLQQMLRVWTARNDTEVNTTELVDFVMRRIDVLLPEMIQTNDTFFGDVNPFIMNSEESIEVCKTKLIQDLQHLDGLLQGDSQGNDQQIIQFIIEELQMDDPRIYVLEPIIHSFQNNLIGTPIEDKIKDLFVHLWKYVESLKLGS